MKHVGSLDSKKDAEYFTSAPHKVSLFYLNLLTFHNLLEENASTHLNEISVALREILGENRFYSSLSVLLFKVMINIKDNLLKALTPPSMKITMMETWTVLYITH